MSRTDALLEQILGELRGLRQALEQRPPSSTISRSDRAHLLRLLPAVGGAIGSETFAVRELFEAQSAALAVALHGLTAKQVGRLFSRAEGKPVDGLIVQKVGEELNVCLWRVVQLPGFSRL